MHPEHQKHDGSRPAETPATVDLVQTQVTANQTRVQELESENRRLLNLVGELLMTNQRLREQYSKNGCGQPVAAR